MNEPTETSHPCSIHPDRNATWSGVCALCAVALSKIEKARGPMPKPGSKCRRALLLVSMDWLMIRHHLLAFRETLERERRRQTLEVGDLQILKTEIGADISQNCTPPGGESSRSRAEPPESDGNTGESDGNSDDTETELEYRIKEIGDEHGVKIVMGYDGDGAENVVKFVADPDNNIVLTPNIEKQIRTAKARRALAQLQARERIAHEDAEIEALLWRRQAGELADTLDTRTDQFVVSIIVGLEYPLRKRGREFPPKLLRQLAGPMTLALTTATLKLRRFRDTGLWTAGGEE